MNIRNYINDAQGRAMERNRSFGGNVNPANGGYLNAVGNLSVAANKGTGTGMRRADGTGVGAPQSQPYIITVSNASATAVSNFDVLGAFQYLNNAGFSNGSLTISGITIASGLPNVTYQNLLSQSQVQPFSIGLTYIESIAGSASQITTPFNINTQDANGNQVLRPIVPLQDPYQQISTVVAVNQQFNIDGFTKLTFNSIGASVVLRLSFFPSQNINLGAGLVGSNVAQAYASPNIVGGQTVTLK